MMPVRPMLASVAAIALAFSLADCGAGNTRPEAAGAAAVYPGNYRADILAGMHAYVLDPTNIRDAYVSEPALRKFGSRSRYTVCVRFNARNGDGRYTGNREVVALFNEGRFDQFTERPAGSDPADQSGVVGESCAQAAFQRF